MSNHRPALGRREELNRTFCLFSDFSLCSPGTRFSHDQITESVHAAGQLNAVRGGGTGGSDLKNDEPRVFHLVSPGLRSGVDVNAAEPYRPWTEKEQGCLQSQSLFHGV